MMFLSPLYIRSSCCFWIKNQKGDFSMNTNKDRKTEEIMILRKMAIVATRLIKQDRDYIHLVIRARAIAELLERNTPRPVIAIILLFRHIVSTKMVFDYYRSKYNTLYLLGLVVLD